MRTITFYYTKHCPNCHVMKPWVRDFHLNVDYVMLDTSSPEIETYTIMSVPTIIVREEDAEVGRIMGAQSKAALEAFFKATGVLT